MHARPRWPRAAFPVVVAASLLAGCVAPGQQGLGTPADGGPTGDEVIRVIDDVDQANLVLYVSNQSFEHGVVGIDVGIDGVAVVGQSFAVEGQHNWIEFGIDLPPGEHTLTATSSTDVEAEHTFEVPEAERRWAVLDYWYYPESDDGSDEVPPSFTFTVHDQQVGFD